jgi:putative transposase
MVFADTGSHGPGVSAAAAIAVEIVRAKPDKVGFAVQSRQWVVERVSACISPNRRLWKDAEATITSVTAFLYATAVLILFR